MKQVYIIQQLHELYTYTDMDQTSFKQLMIKNKVHRSKNHMLLNGQKKEVLICTYMLDRTRISLNVYTQEFENWLSLE